MGLDFEGIFEDILDEYQHELGYGRYSTCAKALDEAARKAVCEEEEHSWRLLTELNNPGMDYCNRCGLEVKAQKWKRTSSSHLIERRDID